MIDWNKYGIDISKVRGGKSLCPKCSHTRKKKNDPCLSVDLATGLFNCHNCDFKGSAKVFERTEPKKEYKRPEARPQAVSPELSQWFKDRGISNKTLLTAKVTQATEYMPQVNAAKACMCFNYYRESELVNIKFRSRDKAFKLVGGAELIFYNLDAIQGREEVIITEGEIDCLSLIEIGATNAVSVPNGASKGSQKLTYLDNCIDAFEDKVKIILATDADEAGEQLQKELIRRLGPERCYMVKYPADCKDANEVLVKHGKDTLWACINMAKQCPIEGIITIGSLRDEIENIAINGYPQVLSLDFIGLNELIKWRGGELTIITGIPSHGKSEFLDQIAIKLAVLHKWRFAVFSPENQPPQVHAIKIMEKLIGKNLKDTTKFERDKAIDFLDDHFYFLSIEECDTTIDGILSKGTELVKRYGINSLIIDPYNVIDHKRDPGQDKQDYISELLTKIIMFSLKYDVHSFLVAHPTKIKKDLVTNKHYVPTLYDISDSAHFYNKPFNGICIYRNFEDNTIDVHTQKIKFKWVGKTGTQKFNYETGSGRYFEMGDKPISDMYHVKDEFEAASKRISQTKIRGERNSDIELDENGKPYAF